MVALGALVARLGWVTPESIRAVIREVVGKKRPDILETDLRVFAAGLAAGAPVPTA